MVLEWSLLMDTQSGVVALVRTDCPSIDRFEYRRLRGKKRIWW